MTTIGGVPVNMASIEWLPQDCLNTVPLHTSSFKEVKVLKAIREDKIVHGSKFQIGFLAPISVAQRFGQ